MSTPPVPPQAPGTGGPFPPGDPRNAAYTQPPFNPDPRVQREQERAWAQAGREQARVQRQQAKAWRDYQRNAAKQQARAMRQQVRAAADAQRAQMQAWRNSHRAQSIIGPLLLIAVAVAALLVYNGRIALPALVTWFARWWPLVLIAAGVLRLVEWALARQQAQSSGVPVRFAIGGGTVWLLILLSVLGLGAQGFHRTGEQWNFGWNGDNLNQFFGSKHEEDAPSVTHTIATEGKLEIHNDRGDVTVYGTSEDGLVHLAEHKEVFASDDSKVDTLLAGLAPQFSGTDNELVVRVPSANNSSANLTVTIPRGVHVVLNSGRGDVAVHSFRAPVSINANRGNVDLSGVNGDVQVRTNYRHAGVEVHSVQGSLQIAGSGDEVNLNDVHGPVTINGEFLGSGRMQHVSGPVAYNAGRISFTAQRIDGDVSFDSDDEFSARGVVGPLTVSTRSRNITLDRVSGDMQVTNSSGHVEITAVAPIGTVAVDNRDGDVTLSLPGSAKFTLAAETTDGNVQSDFPGVSGTASQSRRGSLSTTVGSGGPSIRLNTTHGNIALERNEQMPLPPMPPMPPSLSSVPADMQRSLRDMQKQITQAQNDARKESDQARREALANAEQTRREALAEADQARRDALREADRGRAEGLKEAERARRDAEETRREALREADQARRDAQRDQQRNGAVTPPAAPKTPQQ